MKTGSLSFLLASLFLTVAASAAQPGVCVPREVNNPGYETFCGRFDGSNEHMCMQVSQFCVWRAVTNRPVVDVPEYCWPNCPVTSAR